MEQSYGSHCSALKQPTGQAEGDLKPGVITNHNIGFCKAHSTLNFKANGPRRVTPCEGFPSKSTQRPKCMSKGR